MRQFLVVLSLLCFVVSSVAQTEPASESTPLNAQQIQNQLEEDFTAQDIASTNTWVQSTMQGLELADWMGPLAPLALSPFFGMACLSGLAIYGPEWITDNALLGASGPLQNELLFFVFVGLTILTSLPRLTKVSKPFAQAVDQVETYSVIVILLVIKFLADTSGADGGDQVAMVQLGVFSFTLDTLLAIAMVINIVVINSVKFFFEFLVWLTPLPALDAIFELCNKTLCAALMTVYVFSPTLATIFNLIILAVALVVFRWMSRRVRFYRTMVIDPVLSRIWSPYGELRKPEIVAFPKQTIGPFKPKSRVKLSKQAEGWSMTEANWFLPAAEHTITSSDIPIIRRGWVTHWIEINGDDGEQHILSFSRRYDHALDQLAEQLGFEIADEQENDTSRDVAVEFA